MLISFSVKNFKSFKDRVTLDMQATSLSDLRDTHLIESEAGILLKSAAIYGKNAAGKSKLLEAMQFMKEFVIGSSKDSQSNEPIQVDPFRLNTETKAQPCGFDIEFLLDGVRYRYGFEATEERVEREYLQQRKVAKEYPLFLRIRDEFEVDKKRFPEGLGKEPWTRKNALFLSLAAQLNGELSQKIIGWFNKMVFVHHVCDCEESGITEELFENKKYEALIVKMMQAVDVDMEDIELVRFEEPKTLKTGKKIESDEETIEIRTFHKLYDQHGNSVGLEDFNLYRDESAGTNRYFNLVGYFIKALEEGGVIVMDEMDARLHTLLALSIVWQFNSVTNNRAQFVFTTHDTHLMKADVLRRDQVYFVEKDRFGASSLYTLAAFNVRKDHNYEKNYLGGRYGAIGQIYNVFHEITNSSRNGKKEKPEAQI